MMETIGWIGAWLLALCGLPTALRCHRDGHSNGLTWAFIGMCLGGELLTMIYVWPKQDWPLIINYFLNVVLVGIMGYYKAWPRPALPLRKLSPREERILDRAVANRPTVEEYMNSCCDNERRNMDGGCDNCGDPCI